MSDDYNASTDSILPEIFVSITQVEDMDAAPVTSGVKQSSLLQNYTV